ncbi:MAG: CRISPR-associated endonuclease Cas2 [Candidatus Sungbacteria bacterium]|nr:CRISPR-associated endonuclease Cas2 [Candidatus Sungbacteria bacterium]
MPKLGVNQQKVLLILLAGIALAVTYSPRRHHRIFRQLSKEWKDIDRRALHQAIRSLYESKLVKEIQHSDGSVTIELNKKGKHEALRFDLQAMHIEAPKHWDHKWRVVLFDVPEKEKNLRDTLRRHLKQLGFYELQKSVFVFPYPCIKELDFLIEFYRARKYVRYLEADLADNALHLRKHFSLKS